MDNYSKYLHHVQKVYFNDALKKTFPNATFKNLTTLWEHQQILPFEIYADVLIDGITYSAVMGAKSWKIKGYDTNYGMITLCFSNEEADEADEERTFWLIINPLTLESDYNLSDAELDDFYYNLAHWAEHFVSNKYGVVAPENVSIKDVLITYEQNHRAGNNSK